MSVADARCLDGRKGRRGPGGCPISLIGLLAVTCACSPQLEYAPPPQKTMPQGVDRFLRERIVRMGQANINKHVVSDLLGGETGSDWRWSNQRPRFTIAAGVTEPWNLYVDFTVADTVLKAVGPLTISFVVNDHVLGTRTYKKDGGYEFEQTIPTDVLEVADPAIVGLDVNPVYVAADGVKLGVLMHAIGLRKATAP